MQELVNAIDDNNLEEFTKILKDNPSLDIATLKIDGTISVLNLCAEYNQVDFVKYILDNYTSEKIKEMEEMDNSLQTAIWNDSNEVTELLLSHDKYDVNWANEGAETALYMAVSKKNEEVFEQLLKKTKNPFYTNSRNETIVDKIILDGWDIGLNKVLKHDDFYANFKDAYIEKAIFKDNVKIFEKITEFSSMSENDMLNIATNEGSIKVAAYLVDEGSIIPGRLHILKLIDLMCLKENEKNNPDAVKIICDYLLALKIPFSQYVNSKGQTALMQAITNDNEIIFSEIVEKSAMPIDDEDYQNNNPLFYAIKKNNRDHLVKLLKRKVDVNQINKDGDTPLICAVRKNEWELVHEILKYPTQVNKINNNGENAMSIALFHKNFKVIAELLWYGADISIVPAKFLNEQTIFHINENNQYEKLFTWTDERVIDNFMAIGALGFDLSQKNENGDTFLLHFIKEGHLANFKLMTKCTSVEHHYDKNGNNALLCAMDKNLDEYYKILLGRTINFDLSYKNSNGLDVYDIALKKEKNERIADLLEYDRDFKKQEITKGHNILFSVVNAKKFNNLFDKMKDKISGIFEARNKDGNNIIMLSVINNDIETFKSILKLDKSVSLLIKNKSGENLQNLISKLDKENSEIFTGYLNSYLYDKKNKIN